MPHARLTGLPRFCFSLARVAPPVPWLGYSGAAVELILLFAVPEHETKSYLNLIAGVARLSQNAALVEQLQTAPDAGGILHVLQQVPLPALQAPPVLTPRAGAGELAASLPNPRP